MCRFDPIVRWAIKLRKQHVDDIGWCRLDKMRTTAQFQAIRHGDCGQKRRESGLGPQEPLRRKVKARLGRQRPYTIGHRPCGRSGVQFVTLERHPTG